MRIQGRGSLWYIIPETRGGKHVFLAEMLEDGFCYGKTIKAIGPAGELGVEILGDLEWACEVATYLYHFATINARQVN